MIKQPEVLWPQLTERREHPRPFMRGSRARVRVVVDPRLDGGAADPLLEQLLAVVEHFEVATIGRDEVATIRVGEPVTGGDGLPVTIGSLHTGVSPWSNLVGFAAARASQYGVDRDELQESLIFLAASHTWECDYFISDSIGLATPARSYRDVTVLNRRQAVPLLALLLRSRGDCQLEGDPPFDPSGRVYPALFYWIAMLGSLQPVSTWHTSCYVEPDPSKLLDDDGDLLGLRMYEDLPFDGVRGRFAHALRARDRVLTVSLGGPGHENSDLLVYELQSLTLQLSGALDSAATVVAKQLGVEGESKDWSWQKKQPRQAMRQTWSVSDVQTTKWKHLAEAVSLLRNQIHGAPIQTIDSDDEGTFVILPRAARDKLAELITHGNLGKLPEWGVSLDVEAFINPWTLTETVCARVQAALNEIAVTSTRTDAPDPQAQEWPFSQAALGSAVRLSGLD